MKRTIYEISDDKGYRRGFIANSVGATPATVISWNNKVTRPSKAKLKLLCNVLDIQEEELDLKDA